MRWRERRDLLKTLDGIPAVDFNCTTVRDYGDTDYVDHHGIYNRPDLGKIEIRCPNGKARYAYLKKDGQQICGASKLYRRIHGVWKGDRAYLIGEAMRLAQTSWKAQGREPDLRFTCEHAIYGQLRLRIWDMLGEDAHLSYGIGHSPVLAPDLYRQLKNGLKDLRRTLSGPRLWTAERDDKFTTSLNDQIVTLMSVEVGKQRVQFHLLIGSSVVSVDEYGLWNQVRQNFEDAKRRPQHKASAPYRKSPKRGRRIHKGKRSSK